jgi:hypothetical protein
MTAQPIHIDDPRDPEVILRGLPERTRGEFLRQYRAAVDAAHDPAGYKRLQFVLRAWSVRVNVYAERPRYDEEIAERIAEIRNAQDSDAKEGNIAAGTVPIEEVIAERFGLSVEEAHAYWAEQVSGTSR